VYTAYTPIVYQWGVCIPVESPQVRWHCLLAVPRVGANFRDRRHSEVPIQLRESGHERLWLCCNTTGDPLLEAWQSVANRLCPHAFVV
jgi:hypothetical protein